jgi:hypothetical protein
VDDLAGPVGASSIAGDPVISPVGGEVFVRRGDHHLLHMFRDKEDDWQVSDLGAQGVGAPAVSPDGQVLYLTLEVQQYQRLTWVDDGTPITFFAEARSCTGGEPRTVRTLTRTYVP